MAQRMENKVAIVTGAANGIGAGIARLLAAEGAQVVVADLQEEKGEQVAAEIGAAGGEAGFAKLNVTDLANWQQVTAQTVQQYGKLNVLINNAGLANSGAPLESMDLAREWDLLLQVNLTGAFYGIYAALPWLKQAGGGSIVNTASVAGLKYMTGSNAYAAAKGGLISLAKQVAVEYAKDGIRCNCVCPGATWSANTERLMRETPEIEQLMLSYSAIPRMAQPLDIAQGVLYLASEESAFVTGIALPIDGGFMAK